MNTHSLSDAKRLPRRIFCLVSMAFLCGHAQAQSPRLPQINVKSPLLAVSAPAKPQEEAAKEDAAKAEAAANAAAAQPAAKEAVPPMKAPKDDAALPESRPVSAPAKKDAEAAPLIPAGTVPPVALQPENTDLMPLPAIPEVQINPNSTIIQSLSGITLFKDDRKGPEDTPSAVPASAGPGVNVAPDLTTPDREALISTLRKKYLGKPVSFNGLDEIVKDILAHYSTNQRPMTHVYIPEQEITNTIKIAVLEGRLGDVKFAGDYEKRRWYQAPAPKVPRTLEEQRNQILDMGTISRAASELNLNPWARLGRQEAHPYRRATVALTPGPDLGYTDVELNMKSRDIIPIQAFAGWDNTGTVVLGENRFNLGAVWYDAFNTGYDHQLGIQLQSAENFDLFHAIIASYQIPIRRLNSTVQLYGAFMQSSVSIPTAGVAQLVEGDAWILGGRWFYQLPSWFMTQAAKHAEDKAKQAALYHEIGFGFDYKSQSNNLFFGGINVFPTQIEVAQYVAEYNLRQTDKWGESLASLAVFYSPGSITRNNTDEAFAAARANGTADYVYVRGTFSRMVDFGAFSKHLNDIKLLVRGTGQWASENLVASEQLGLGGQDSVRGYSERVMRGDKGLFIQTELYSPAMHPLRWLAKKTPDRWMDAEERTDELRFLVFYDYGWGDATYRTAAEPGDLNLSSVGIGVRYRFNKSMTFRFDYGFRLEQLDVTKISTFDQSPRYSNSGDGYAHMGLSLSF